MDRVKRIPHCIIIILIYIVTLALVSLMVMRLGLSDSLLYMFSIPCILSAFDHGRRIYLSMLLLLAIVAVWVTSQVSRDFHASLISITIAIPSSIAIAETIRHLTLSRERAAEALRSSEERLRYFIDSSSAVIYSMYPQGEFKKISFISKNIEDMLGYRSEDISDLKHWQTKIHPDDKSSFPAQISDAWEKKITSIIEYRVRHKDGSYRWLRDTNKPVFDEKGQLVEAVGSWIDITERVQAGEMLEGRLAALTRPPDDNENIIFEDLFNLDDIQRLQDEFAQATGVASIITRLDGTPITQSSNFCRLCSNIIRNTDKGRINCFKSDAVLGRFNPEGPIIQPCISGGLWDAGTSISVDGKHIANWLIGQVRDETQTEEKMREYAREIGADEEAVVEAFYEVPSMSREQLGLVAQMLFTLARQLSTIAYHNVQQARFITERKQAEAALRESEERFRAIFEQAGVGVSQVVSKTGEYVRLNKRYADILGYSVEAFKGLTFQEITHPDDLQEDLGKMQRLLAGEIRGFSMEKRLFHKNGSIVWVNLTVSPMWDIGEEPHFHIAVVEDITERKQAEAAHRESEERYRTLFEYLPIPAYTKNRVGEYTSCNAENRRYWAVSPVGRTDEELLDPETAAMLREFDLRVMETGKMLIQEECLPDTPAGKRQFISRKVPLYDGRGDISGILGASLDITERKQIEEERLKLRKLESVGVLAGGIAHDFNNLLTGVFGNIELAKMFLAAGHKSHKYLESAMRSMESATGLTKQLLTFARGGDPIKKTLSVGDVIIETAQFSMRGSSAGLKTYIAPDLWPVEADKGQLSQVISNLVINAQQAMPAGGTITIAAENIEIPEGRQVQIIVQDEGVGIVPQYLDKIFDPYFTTKQKGSGLGLATTHSIISKHDGTISADSPLGQGTCFTIRLPASEKTVEMITGKSLDEFGSPLAGTLRILVLDDEEIVREVLGEVLESMGCEVAFTVDGQETIAEYRAAYEAGKTYALVITDLTLPGGMSGREAAREILKIDPQAKIIVSSGYATDPVMANYKDYGFLGIAVKPYRVADLQAVIQRVLRM